MNHKHFLIRRFNQGTLFLLATLLIFSCIWAYFSNQALIQEASVERANYIAGAISDSLTHAMEVGVPLQEMRGVEVLLRARANENEYIHRIEVLNLSDKIMWQADGGRQEGEPVKVTASVRFRDQTVAYVQVSVYPTGLFPIMLNAVFLLVIVCIMAYVACYESIIFSLGRGVILREQAKAQMRQAILQGQLDTIVIGQNRSNSDRALYGMVQRLRRLNEKMWRMRRLTTSLRITEPDEEVRTNLEKTLAQAEEHLVFADRKPEKVVLTAFAIDIRWLYFLTCVAIESTLQVMVPDKILWMSPLLVFLGAGGAMLGLFVGDKLALRHSSQALITLGTVIIFLGFLVVWSMPITLYSVLARFVVYMGVMIVLCGCYGVVKLAKESQEIWPLAMVSGGLLLGRLFSLLSLEWFGSKILVLFASLLILLVIFLTNKFSWGQTDIWRRPIGSKLHVNVAFAPLPFFNGILSGLLFSFALATFVFNEGYGNEIIVTLSWFFLGIGAWFGYQLSDRWRFILWGVAFMTAVMLILEHDQIEILSLLFCFSVSALEWHIRQHSRHEFGLINYSDLLGAGVGALIYFTVLIYSFFLNISILFLGVLVTLGLILYLRYNPYARRERG